MVGSFVRLAAAALFCAMLAACTTNPSTYSGNYGNEGVPPSRPQGPGLQCVPYAREHAHIPIYGDAYTWWDQALGRYARAVVPSEGSVLVLFNYAGPERAHLAVVRSIVNQRQIRVDHANWLDDGAIFVDDPVQDVSPENDWSEVRVFNIRTGAWGSRIYPVQGFIGPGPETNPVLEAGKSPPVRVAQKPTTPEPTDSAQGPPPRHDYIADLLANDPALDDSGKDPESGGDNKQ
jgi:hypothetical protein